MALKMKKKEVSTEAVWVPFDEDTKIQLVGSDQPEYQLALERARRRLQRNDAQFAEGAVGVVSGEKTELQTQAMLLSHFVVKDWEGVQDEEGNKLSFTPDAAADIMLAEHSFFLFVLRESGKIAAQAKGELEETVEKPSPASPGKGNGRAKPKNESSSTNA